MSTVVEQLQRARTRHRKIYFRPNAGNAGDALINVGFYSLAARVGLPYTEIGDDFDYASINREDLLILSGGGTIVPYWRAGSDLLRRLTQFNFPLMLMPQSIAGRQEILSLLRPQDVLFLRESYSYDYAQSLGLQCRVLRDHDLAFATDPDLLNQPLSRPQLSVKHSRKMLQLAYHYLRSRLTSSLVALRTDRESRLPGCAKPINDISTIARFGTRTRALNLFSARWLLKALSWYKVVETDRLHVCLGCLLVGTQVVLRENAYHKIRGVFEYSIRPHPTYAPLVSFLAADREAATTDATPCANTKF